MNLAIVTSSGERFGRDAAATANQAVSLLRYAHTVAAKVPHFADAGGVMSIHLYDSDHSHLHAHVIIPKDQLCHKLDAAVAKGSHKRKHAPPALSHEEDLAALGHLVRPCKDVELVLLSSFMEQTGSARATPLKIRQEYNPQGCHIYRIDDHLAMTSGRPGEPITWYPIGSKQSQRFAITPSKEIYMCGVANNSEGYDRIFSQQCFGDKTPPALTIKTPDGAPIRHWRMVKNLKHLETTDGVWVVGDRTQEEARKWPPNKYWNEDVEAMEKATGASHPFGAFVHEELDMVHHHDEPLLLFLVKPGAHPSKQQVEAYLSSILHFAYKEGIAPRCHLVVGLGEKGLGLTSEGAATCMSTLVEGQEGKEKDVVCFLFVDPPNFYKGLPTQETASKWLQAYKGRDSRMLLT